MGVFLARFARATGSLRSRNGRASLAQLARFARAFGLSSLAQWAILFFFLSSPSISTGVFLARFARATGSLRSRNWLASLAQLARFARAFGLASLAQWAILFLDEPPQLSWAFPRPPA